MKPIPYVLIKCAMTLDGYLDDTSDKRLILSNEKDFAEVEKVRESVDAILVGAQTIRKDNPRLVLKSGKALTKVTITSSGNLDPHGNFFSMGESEKIVYTTSTVVEKLQKEIPATVVAIGETINIRAILEDLYERGVRRLLVEGGSTIISQFLQEALVDELQVSIAPLILGEKDAPQFIKENVIKKQIPLQLQSTRTLDNMIVLTYTMQQSNNEPMKQWIEYVINLSKKSPISDTAFIVGAALVDKEGNLIAYGFSAETNSNIHAEEIVFEKIKDKNIDLSETTLYTSLEPCNRRLSKTESCVDLILKYGVNRIVFAATEPPIFVEGQGAKRLKEEGVDVVQLAEYENEVIKIQSETIQQKWQNTLPTI